MSSVAILHRPGALTENFNSRNMTNTEYSARQMQLYPESRPQVVPNPTTMTPSMAQPNLNNQPTANVTPTKTDITSSPVLSDDVSVASFDDSLEQQQESLSQP